MFNNVNVVYNIIDRAAKPKMATYPSAGEVNGKPQPRMVRNLKVKQLNPRVTAAGLL